MIPPMEVTMALMVWEMVCLTVWETTCQTAWEMV